MLVKGGPLIFLCRSVLFGISQSQSSFNYMKIEARFNFVSLAVTNWFSWLICVFFLSSLPNRASKTTLLTLGLRWIPILGDVSYSNLGLNRSHLIKDLFNARYCWKGTTKSHGISRYIYNLQSYSLSHFTEKIFGVMNVKYCPSMGIEA